MPRKNQAPVQRQDPTVLAAQAAAQNTDPSYWDLENGFSIWVNLVNNDIPNFANYLSDLINAMGGL